MRRTEDRTDEAEDSGRDKAADASGSEYSGFLIMWLRAGDRLLIGDSIVSVNEVKDGKIKLAVKAKRHTLIRRLDP